MKRALLTLVWSFKIKNIQENHLDVVPLNPFCVFGFCVIVFCVIDCVLCVIDWFLCD